MGLKENLASEPVTRLALRKLVAVGPATPVREAIRTLRSQELGCAVVVDDAGVPLGTFTEEVLMKLLLSGPDSLDEPVAEHLSPRFACVAESEPISRVLEEMQGRDLRFICVTDAEGRAVALTGQRGLMEYVAEHFPEEILSQRIGKPYLEQREGA